MKRYAPVLSVVVRSDTRAPSAVTPSRYMTARAIPGSFEFLSPLLFVSLKTLPVMLERLNTRQVKAFDVVCPSGLRAVTDTRYSVIGVLPRAMTPVITPEVG